jgi:hypothetical protein
MSLPPPPQSPSLTSSMSGSFHPPGPAHCASPAAPLSRLRNMLGQLGNMSCGAGGGVREQGNQVWVLAACRAISGFMACDRACREYRTWAAMTWLSGARSFNVPHSMCLTQCPNPVPHPPTHPLSVHLDTPTYLISAPAVANATSPLPCVGTTPAAHAETGGGGGHKRGGAAHGQQHR